jgi:RNA polymerase sigma-70 factor (ECF subfamily)
MDSGAGAEPGFDLPTRMRFEALLLPHLDAAFKLARWLTGDDHDARDVVQEALLRAIRFFNGFRGDRARPWLLAIVRNAAYAWISEHRNAYMEAYEPDIHGSAGYGAVATPESELDRLEQGHAVNDALGRLPIEIRETMVLRELHDLSYKEIAAIQDIPVGTVMSRLSRGRRMLVQHIRRRIPAIEYSR